MQTTVYEYPANTIPGERVVTEELLQAQQNEINASMARRNMNMSKDKPNAITIEGISKVVLVIFLACLMCLGGLLVASSIQESKSKQVTDGVADRVVDGYREGQ